ncbi:MAG: aldehyde dehydrogenase family protein [Candidatus Aenigmarchaeota archaeon]|nr:aldehyde dehydrogenase family protein [Candidatus Aenigmarchaeota archaeon]
MAKTYSNYIDGKWVKSESGKTFDNINPATGEMLCRFQASTQKDVLKAVTAAEKAFAPWKNTPAPKRGEILYKAARIMEERKEELAKMLTQENGKNMDESRGEIQEGIDITLYVAGEGRRLFGETTPSELSNKFCMTIREPVGIIGMITPWNFPFAIPAWKIPPALVAGNCIVFKPSSDAPWLGARLVEILEEAGLPPGVLNMVTGSGGVVGKEIANNPKIDGLSFTGSTSTGKDIYAAGAARLAGVGLEMGGKNPQIVLKDADLDLAVDGAIWGGFGTAGQRCTATSRLIIEKAVLDKFTQKFVQRVRNIKVGNGLDKGVLTGPIINGKQKDKILAYIKIGKEEGAKLLTGGNALEEGKYGKGNFIEPTVFTNVKKTMTIAQEEIFGPVVSIMPVSDFEEAIEVANSTEYGLSASIYTNDVTKAFRAMRMLESGIVYVNAPTIGAEAHMPFGGIKNTGNGKREAGSEAIKEFTELKSIFVDYSGGLQRAQIDIGKK